ncbi:D-ribose pyranase [Lawsonibacter sp. LCP25S3_G6]|uniref:D-ribose pyranase n=1 Tax=unclassified Lawsonibacter TaxID=2617946 RepID=UPI003F9DED56
MTETGILNRELAAELSKMGHTDRLLIADAGLAIPNTTRVIDLSLAPNVPTAVDVLKVILEHFSVEGIILSQATLDVSPSREKEFKACFAEDLPCEVVSHAHFRDDLTKEVKFAIRTGDFTANSNIILISAGGPRWYCER